MSFTFTRAFPSDHLEWVSQLVSDASGKRSRSRTDALKVVSNEAKVHSADGNVVDDRRPAGPADRLPEHDRYA